MSANPEHVTIVREGVNAIKEWKRRNRGVSLNLVGAQLEGINLCGTDLSIKKLVLADRSGTKDFWTYLCGADLTGADLTEANLVEAHMPMANLFRANLSRANLFAAYMPWANLYRANLSRANLVRANLFRANFVETNLSFTDFAHAELRSTVIGDCDLSQVKGLETTIHGALSNISVSTLIKSFHGAGNRLTSKLKIFFINAGVPKELLEALPQIMAEVKYYTTFVAYGQPDAVFAKKLINDFRKKGVSCWLYSTDYTPGERTWREIGLMRREAEKMIVLCSAKSLIRDGLLKEIEAQIDEDPEKLVPISIGNLWKERGFLVIRAGRDLKPFLMEKNYTDFGDESTYEVALDRLLRALEKKSKQA